MIEGTFLSIPFYCFVERSENESLEKTLSVLVLKLADHQLSSPLDIYHFFGVMEGLYQISYVCVKICSSGLLYV